jgi:hypothetical protein
MHLSLKVTRNSYGLYNPRQFLSLLDHLVSKWHGYFLLQLVIQVRRGCIFKMAVACILVGIVRKDLGCSEPLKDSSISFVCYRLTAKMCWDIREIECVSRNTWIILWFPKVGMHRATPQIANKTGWNRPSRVEMTTTQPQTLPTNLLRRTVFALAEIFSTVGLACGSTYDLLCHNGASETSW